MDSRERLDGRSEKGAAQATLEAIYGRQFIRYIRVTCW